MSIISAGTSNTTSLVYTGDTTGAMVFQTNGTTEAMRITSGQNVGIGTTSPQARLHQNSTNDGVQAIFTGAQTGTTQSILLRSQYQTNNGTAGFANIGWFDNGSQGGGITFGTTSNGSGTTGTPTERMRIDSSGRVTMPYQPIFHAQKNNGPQVAVEVITFNTVVTNVGSHYSTSTSRFTAPIAGTYHFYASVLDDGAAASHQGPRVALRVNGSNKQMQQNFYGRSDSFYNFIHVEYTATLAASDYVDLYNDSGGPIYGSAESFGYFGGWLIG